MVFFHANATRDRNRVYLGMFDVSAFSSLKQSFVDRNVRENPYAAEERVRVHSSWVVLGIVERKNCGKPPRRMQ